MNEALRLCIDFFNLSVRQVTHNIDIMCCKIKCYPNITYAWRERTKSSRMKVENLSKLTSSQALSQLQDRRIKSFDMAYSNLNAATACQIDERKRIFNRTRYRLLDQNMDASLQQV